jgi:hypothetical protein
MARTCELGDGCLTTNKTLVSEPDQFFVTLSIGAKSVRPRETGEAHPVSDAFQPAESNSFHTPAEREALLFCCLSTSHAGACANSAAGTKGGGQDARVKEKYPREKDTPLGACRAPARQVRETKPGFLIGHRATAPALPQLRHSCRRLPVRKGTDVLPAPAARPMDLGSPPHRGAEQCTRAVVARTFQKCRRNAHARVAKLVLPHAVAGVVPWLRKRGSPCKFTGTN